MRLQGPGLSKLPNLNSLTKVKDSGENHSLLHLLTNSSVSRERITDDSGTETEASTGCYTNLPVVCAFIRRKQHKLQQALLMNNHQY